MTPMTPVEHREMMKANIHSMYQPLQNDIVKAEEVKAIVDTNVGKEEEKAKENEENI